jgi:hypothetical protein
MRIRLCLVVVTAALLGLSVTGTAQAAITVANQADGGAGSLRQALIEAPPGETVIVPAGTYTLTSDPLEIVKSVTITGHGAGDTTIRAGVAMGVFEITGPLDATISGVTIRDGNIAGTAAQGAGIQSVRANLTIRDVVLTNNTVNANGAGGVSGGIAEGGAIWASEGSVSLTNATVNNNVATSVGGSEKHGGIAEGGGIWVAEGDVTVASSSLGGNRLDARGGQAAANTEQFGGLAAGGGIWLTDGNLSLRDSELSSNTLLAAAGSGGHGGIAEGGGVWMTAGSATVANTRLSNNLLVGRGGQGPASTEQFGGLAMGGGIWLSEGNLSYDSGEGSSNTLLGSGGSGGHGGIAEGGGVWMTAGSIGVSTAKLSGNMLDARGGQGAPTTKQSGGLAMGGGVWVSEAPLTLAGGEGSSNTLLAGAGSGAHGGIAEGGSVWAANPQVTVSNATASGNLLEAPGGQGLASAEQVGGLAMGGGLWLTQEKNAVPSSVTGSTFARNTVDGSPGPGAKSGFSEGGGIWLVGEYAPISVANTTIASNLVRYHAENGGFAQGGGLWAIAPPPSSLALTSLTISGNRIEATGAQFAGGGNLYWEDAVTIRNSIVASGVGPAGSENCSKPPENASLGFNLESLNQCGFHTGGDQVNKDPLLGSLQANGGPTATMAPAANSPAIDQGNAFGLTTDQRGVVRPIDFPTIPNSAAAGADGSDIGAFELQPSNAFRLGKLKKNKKKGTAKLTVKLPQPSAGALILEGKGLKTQKAKITGQASVKLKVIGKGKVKKALRKRGKRKVQIKVTYTPTGNSAAAKTRKAKLVRKLKKHGKPRKHANR